MSSVILKDVLQEFADWSVVGREIGISDELLTDISGVIVEEGFFDHVGKTFQIFILEHGIVKNNPLTVVGSTSIDLK